jgi:hypothetical protein
VPVGEPFGGREREDERAFVTRVSERLAHRMRATTARDFEQLVLERFKEVAMVKCFTTGDIGTDRISPGIVRVVIVPHLKASTSKDNFMPRAGAGLIVRVKSFLEAHASACVNVVVSNPVYEQILVKCVMKLQRGVPEGRSLIAINRALDAYISPWDPAENQFKFGWCIFLGHLAAYIRNLDSVDYVTSLSLLIRRTTLTRFSTTSPISGRTPR